MLMFSYPRANRDIGYAAIFFLVILRPGLKAGEVGISQCASGEITLLAVEFTDMGRSLIFVVETTAN